MTVKLVVIYPRPDDIDAFETVYNRDHVPMAVAKLAGKTEIVASKIVGSPQGTSPFHRIAEIHFPYMEALQACAASEGGKQTIANAVAISSGGTDLPGRRRGSIRVSREVTYHPTTLVVICCNRIGLVSRSCFLGLLLK